MEEKILNILTEIQNKLIEHDSRFERIDSRFERIDGRFERIERKLVEHDNRFDQLERKIEKEIKVLGDELHTEIQVVNDNVEALRQDFNHVEMVTSKNALDISKLKLAR